MKGDPGAALHHRPYTIVIDGIEGPLHVHAFRGAEELSAPWRFDVVMSGALEAEMERVALGQRATFTLDLDGKRRELHGVVSDITLVEVESREDRDEIARRARYRVRVVPRMALLRYTRRTRVFQGLDVPRITADILGKAGIAVRFALRRSYPAREYCTHYEETDLAFVRRILAEAGIAFYFFGGRDAAMAAPAPSRASAASLLPLVPGESVVLVDDAGFYPAVAGDDPSLLAGLAVAPARQRFSLRFKPNAGDLPGYDGIARFELRNAVRPNSAIFRDFDPERPLVHLQGVAASTEPFAASSADLARAAAASAANAASAVTQGRGSSMAMEAFDALATMHVYEHHSPFLFPKWEAAAEEAPVLLRQKRRRASVASGESGCHDLSAGHAFELHGHLAGALDRGWLVTSVRHVGQVGDAEPRLYTNEFECVPSEMHHPPKRPKRRSVQVALTATVVGPPGEDDIFTDDQGRIKVQFHWDRHGKMDDRSSCWLRAMQPWAGAGWGHQFIPRIGMEAVVVFEGGDPDRPMVIGTHYNRTHPPSFGLPAAKTRSGIRTRSTPTGDGFNELSFEDRAGKEEVLLHAHRLLKEEIGSDRITDIGSNDITRIARSRSVAIGANLEHAVTGDRHDFVKGAHYESIKGNRTASVKGVSTLKVQGDMNIEVGKADEPRLSEHFVHGTQIQGASDRIELKAVKGIRLTCGESLVDIGPEEILVTSKRVRLEGRDSVLARGPGPFLRLDTSAELVSEVVRVISEKASLELDQDAKLDGKEVKLNCKGVQASAAGKRVSVKTKKVKLRLTDQDFAALGNMEYILNSGGARYEGTTDAEGRLEVDVPEEATSVGLTVFTSKRPKGRQIRYQIRLDPLAPVDTIPGIKGRLENLGYYWGACNDVVDEIAKRALAEFQRDHHLDPTGEPDAATQAMLVRIAEQ